MFQATIRQATLQDAPELARLRWDFSPHEVALGQQSCVDFGRIFRAFVEQALAGGDWVIWVAEQDGRLIANMYVQCIRKVPRPGRGAQVYGYLTNVYVEPGQRNQGLGSAMLRHIIVWARAARLTFLIVWPSEESIPFYQRLGFVRSPEALELHLDT